MTCMPQVHRWDVQEISFAGPEAGNPCGQCITAVFTGAREQRTVQGFYDGDGRYMVRFMPAFEGEYTYQIDAGFTALSGSFLGIFTGIRDNSQRKRRYVMDYNFTQIEKKWQDYWASYGNQIGLTTGYVHEVYDEGYVAKRMEIGAVVAAAPKNQVKRLEPKEGNIVLLIGGRTGRDGIGGATGSSISA